MSKRSYVAHPRWLGMSVTLRLSLRAFTVVAYTLVFTACGRFEFEPGTSFGYPT